MLDWVSAWIFRFYSTTINGLLLHIILSSSFNQQMVAPEKRVLEINHGASQIHSPINPSTSAPYWLCNLGLVLVSSTINRK